MDDGVPVYLIPDGLGGWLKTSPQTHNRYIAKANLRSAGKLRNVARLIKYWRYCRSPQITLSSFHAEMLLAYSRLGEGPKSYSQCYCELLSLLRTRSCRALQDPANISGLLSFANTEAKLDRGRAAVETSAYHAAKALIAEQQGSAAEAIR